MDSDRESVVMSVKANRARAAIADVATHTDPQRWANLGSAAVGDALRSLGKAFQCMDSGLRPLSPELAIAGPTYTVRCYPGATWAIERALEQAQSGDVLVVDAGGFTDAIVMGGLMSQRAAKRGLAAAIVDGAVRDVDQIRRIPFPLYSRGICPRAGTFAEIGEWQTIICCGRIPVSPGDWIVADGSGIVVVPSEMQSAVFAAATEIHQKEQSIARSLRNGKNLAESALASAGNRNGQAKRSRATRRPVHRTIQQ